MALFDELMALHCRYNALYEEAFALDDELDGDADVLEALGQAIIRISKPKTVGDVMAFPNQGLRRDGFIVLIERDAPDHYEDIEGYIDFILGDLDPLEEAITSDHHGFNGHDLCEWIDRTFPYDAKESKCLIS